MMDLIDALVKIGFTRQESLLYLTLCQEGELSGYEAAKVTGIPRSNTYLALAGLVDKGGAYKIEGEVIRYSAIPISNLAANRQRELLEIIEFLKNNVPTRTAPVHSFLTVTGAMQIVHQIKNIINQAQERIYLSFSFQELRLVETELQQAVKRGLKVVIITDQQFELAQAVIYQHKKRPGQIRLIADSAHVLTGELSERPNAACLYSQNPNLVELIKDSLTNEIALIRLGGSHDESNFFNPRGENQ